MRLGRLAAGLFGFALLGGCASIEGPAVQGQGAAAPALSFRIVQSLTTEVGPRLAGSPQEAAARDWAVRTLKELKFSRVTIEPFAVKAWVRGPASAALVDYGHQELAVVALGGSISTPKSGITAPVAFVASFDDLLNAPLGSYAGKIVFVNDRMVRAKDGAGYGVAVRKRSKGAVEAGKRARLRS